LTKQIASVFWLRLIIDESKTEEDIIVILKTQAEPTKKFLIRPYIMSLAISIRDKYDALKDIGSVIILNLIPHYETYSNKLLPLKSEVICENLSTIHRLSGEHSRVVIAWGDHPAGLFKV
jgi:hypothetical protein